MWRSKELRESLSLIAINETRIEYLLHHRKWLNVFPHTTATVVHSSTDHCVLFEHWLMCVCFSSLAYCTHWVLTQAYSPYNWGWQDINTEVKSAAWTYYYAVNCLQCSSGKCKERQISEWRARLGNMADTVKNLIGAITQCSCSIIWISVDHRDTMNHLPL